MGLTYKVQGINSQQPMKEVAPSTEKVEPGTYADAAIAPISHLKPGTIILGGQYTLKVSFDGESLSVPTDPNQFVEDFVAHAALLFQIYERVILFVNGKPAHRGTLVENNIGARSNLILELPSPLNGGAQGRKKHLPRNGVEAKIEQVKTEKANKSNNRTKNQPKVYRKKTGPSSAHKELCDKVEKDWPVLAEGRKSPASKARPESAKPGKKAPKTPKEGKSPKRKEKQPKQQNRFADSDSGSEEILISGYAVAKKTGEIRGPKQTAAELADELDPRSLQNIIIDSGSEEESEEPPKPPNYVLADLAKNNLQNFSVRTGRRLWAINEKAVARHNLTARDTTRIISKVECYINSLNLCVYLCFVYLCWVSLIHLLELAGANMELIRYAMMIAEVLHLLLMLKNNPQLRNGYIYSLASMSLFCSFAATVIASMRTSSHHIVFVILFNTFSGGLGLYIDTHRMRAVRPPSPSNFFLRAWRYLVLAYNEPHPNDPTCDEWKSVVVFGKIYHIRKTISTNAVGPTNYRPLNDKEYLNQPDLMALIELAIGATSGQYYRVVYYVANSLGLLDQEVQAMNSTLTEILVETDEIMTYEYIDKFHPSEANLVDGRADVISSGELKHAPLVYSVRRTVGWAGTNRVDEHCVSVEIITQLMSNITLFNCNYDLETCDSTLFFHFKNITSTNLQRHNSLRENILINTLNLAKAYMRYKRSQQILLAPSSGKDEAAL